MEQLNWMTARVGEDFEEAYPITAEDFRDLMYDLYEVINDLCFNGELADDILIAMTASGDKVLADAGADGCWDPKQRAIWIHSKFQEDYDQFGLKNSQYSVIPLLWHEMIHQYCADHGIEDCAHGYHLLTFKDVAIQKGGIFEGEPDEKNGYADVRLKPEVFSAIQRTYEEE